MKSIFILLLIIPLSIKGGYFEHQIDTLEVKRINKSIEYFKNSPKIVRSLKAYKNRVINKKI